MGTIVSFFFSGFVMGKVPFSLSPRFRPMLQRGVDLASLDVSYFTGLSYYILLLFSSRGPFSLVFRWGRGGRGHGRWCGLVGAREGGGPLEGPTRALVAWGWGVRGWLGQWEWPSLIHCLCIKTRARTHNDTTHTHSHTHTHTQHTHTANRAHTQSLLRVGAGIHNQL
jgi:hypothetical protein